MQKYSAVLEISRFLCVADDVTRVRYVEVVRIFYIFHTKLEIHKFDFLAFIFIILCENMNLYGKNTEKFENGIRNLKKVAEILVFGTLRDVIILGLGPIFGHDDVNLGVKYFKYVKTGSICVHPDIKRVSMRIIQNDSILCITAYSYLLCF